MPGVVGDVEDLEGIAIVTTFIEGLHRSCQVEDMGFFVDEEDDSLGGHGRFFFLAVFLASFSAFSAFSAFI